MVLLIGVILLAIGIVYMIHRLITVRFGVVVSRIVLFIVSFSLILSATVHGIWLGLSVLIIGYLWLEYYGKKLKTLAAGK